MLRRRTAPRRPGETGWPLRLTGITPLGDPILLRPMERADSERYYAVRRANRDWLRPWDATSPDEERRPLRTFEQLVAHNDAEARAGRSVPLVIEVEGQLAGQVTAASIILGSFRSCSVGYWVTRAVAGRGVTSTALATLGDHLLGSMRLHRIEVNVRPENTASLAVVRKLGFREEGYRPRLLHIDGAWRDHIAFALTGEDLTGSTLSQRLVTSSQPSLWRHTDNAPHT